MRKEWVAWLLLASLLLSGCGKTAQVPDEAQAAEEAVIQVETPAEEPAQENGISPIEPGQWAKYAEIYDAYFLGEDRRLPLDFMFARPILQMADLDQNGVPELIVYHGVATAMMIFAIFTIEDDTVKSLTELLSWNWAIPTDAGDCVIPTTGTVIPDEHQEILCDSAYVALDVRVLPFDQYLWRDLRAAGRGNWRGVLDVQLLQQQKRRNRRRFVQQRRRVLALCKRRWENRPRSDASGSV